MKKILDTLKLKWAEYLLEIFVIVIGILVAYTLNNWNEERNDNVSEKYFLNKILDNLRSDSTNLTVSIGRSKFVANGMDSALFIIDHQGQFSKEEFVNYSHRILMVFDFNQNRVTYDNLVSSGRIDLISNDEVTIELFKYYDPSNKYHDLDEALEYFTRQIYMPFILEFDNINWNWDIITMMGYDSIYYNYQDNSTNKSLDEYRNSTKMINYIKQKRAIVTNQKILYQNELMPQIEKLTRLIRHELY